MLPDVEMKSHHASKTGRKAAVGPVLVGGLRSGLNR